MAFPEECSQLSLAQCWGTMSPCTGPPLPSRQDSQVQKPHPEGTYCSQGSPGVLATLGSGLAPPPISPAPWACAHGLQ